MKYLLFFITLFLSLFSCTSNIGEEDEIKRAIGKYNAYLISSHRSGDTSPFKDVAAELERKKIGHVISEYLKEGKTMEAELHRMDFKGVEIKGDMADVRTEEDWSYRWVDYRTGKEVEPLKDIHYKMVYHLAKRDKKWLVERVEDINLSQKKGVEGGKEG